MKARVGETPNCSSGFCSRAAVAAVYPRVGGTVVIRVDHLDVDGRAADWRCPDCLHDDIDQALDVAVIEANRRRP